MSRGTRFVLRFRIKLVSEEIDVNAMMRSEG